MKVLVNGGLNLSELDGWWAEAYAPDLGWALGDGQEHGDDPAWDAAEAEMLYESLERKVIPDFYNRDGQGIPTAWVARMRESMARLTPLFSADRAVREYTGQHYLPAATALRSRVANKGASGRQIVDWQHNLDQKWAALRFGEVRVETKDQQHVFAVQVYLNDLDPKAVQVELYADGLTGGSPVRQEMKNLRPLTGASGGYIYSASVSAARPPGDYTARVIPHCDGVAVPLEAGHILWQS
jgi:starch phosphorylase